MRRTRGRRLKRQNHFLIISLITMLAVFTTGYAAFSTKIRLNTKGNIKQGCKGQEWTFDFEKNAQEFEAECKGIYKIELWGAEGGSSDNNITAKGAYVSGNIELSKNEKLYVYVGEHPTFYSGSCYSTNENNTFNGTTVGTCAGGGGATDIRITTSENWYDEASLASRIMVAAAGGGTPYPTTGVGGYGGELTGGDGTGISPSAQSAYFAGKGGTQTEYNFGVGTKTTSTAAPGSGYYGGQVGYGGNAGGGSSFISGYKGCVAIKSQTDITPKDNCTIESEDISCSYHYSGKIFTDGVMIAGNKEMPSHNEGEDFEIGNSGDGFAKITFVKHT